MSGLDDGTDHFCLVDGLNSLNTTANSHSSAASVSVGNVLVSILTSILSLLIVVGNGLIIVSVAIVKKLRQPANYLIVSLALSDFLVGLIVLPLTIVYDFGGEWIFGSMICDVHVSFDVICCTASIMNLCMISIDRYLIITKPMTYPKRRNGRLMAILITTAWLVSCLIIIPALFGFTENVKDGPHWLELGSSSVIDTGETPLNGASESSGSSWNDTLQTEAMLEANTTSFWDSQKSLMQTRNSYLMIDLGQTYQITRIGIRRIEEEVQDMTLFTLETNVCDDDNLRYAKHRLLVQPDTHGLEEAAISGDVQARYIRLMVNSTTGMQLPMLRLFKMYGEKVEGKTCLISQEVWFTIYSTVWAFYIPLAVMLCMYWRIYMEASRFEVGNVRSRAGSGSKDCWGYNSRGIRPNSVKLKKSSTSSSKSFLNLNNNMPNSTEVLKLRQAKRYDEEVFEPNERLLPNGCCKANDISIKRTSDYDDEKRIESSCSGETLSSKFVLCDQNADNGSRVSALVQERTLLKPSEKLLNDPDERLPLYKSNSLSLPNKFNRQRNISVSTSLLPSSGVLRGSNRTQITRMRWRALSENSSLKHKSFDNDCSKISREGSKFIFPNYYLTNGTRRYPTIKENTVFDFHCNVENSVVCENPGWVNSYSDGLTQKPVYTRTCQECVIKHSLASLNDIEASDVFLPETPKRCNKQSLFFRRCSTQVRRSVTSRTISVSATKTREIKGFRRLSTLSQSCRMAGMKSTKHSSRRSTVLSHIRKRVSMAKSRDRMRNVKATRTLGIIVGAFTFCWLPFFTVTFLRPFICENPESQDCIPLWLVRLVLWLGYLNSALNPFIYIGFSPDLRKTFRFLLSCKCTNVDRRLSQTELRHAITRERRASLSCRSCGAESIV